MMHDPKKAWNRRYSSGLKWGGSRQILPPLRAGSRVLEIGCGTGNTILASENGWRITAVDISPMGLEIAQKRAADRGLDVTFLERDVTFPLCDLGLFDCVLLHHVLGSMLEGERKRCVGNVLEVLHADGIVSFLDMSASDMRFGKGEQVEEGTFLKKDGILHHFFTVDEVRGLFSDLEEVELGINNWTQKGGLARSRVHGLFHW